MHNYLTFSYLEIRSIDICREFHAHLKCRARNFFFKCRQVILREINLDKFRASKIVILTFLEVPNVDLVEFLAISSG